MKLNLCDMFQGLSYISVMHILTENPENSSLRDQIY